MAEWPVNGATDWNTKMKAFIDVGHATDGTHNEAGLTRQVVNVQTGAVATGTTAIPNDDTIPQKTEGDEYMTLAITPTSATNKLKIEVMACLSHSAVNDNICVALFQDATANALAVVNDSESYQNRLHSIPLVHYMLAETAVETTFKVRAGGHSGATTTFNGQSGSRVYGGVLASSITITEIQV